ncbi:ABC transporter permease [Silvibacterium acidisoli]|uniref:ABC transporter permease n=1 Tax=Acidobacteriaceae bacterium ZG23-2 TaxID=2883246 RepID=UPI00406C6147
MIDDLKFALRQLHKAPGFALAVIATLALGVGVNTAVFSMVDGFLLRKLPYPEPEKLALLMTHVEGMHGDAQENSSVDTKIWRNVHDNARSVTIAAYEESIDSEGNGANLNPGSAGGNAARYVRSGAVTSHYFEALGIRPYLGREFSEEETLAGGQNAAILSYALWQSTFHGDTGVVGRSVEIKGEPYSVVGVMPANLAAPGGNAELWTSLKPGINGACDGYDCGIMVRLKPGTSWQQAQSELGRIEVHPDYEHAKSARLYAQPMEQSNASGMKPKLTALMLVVGAILLIACANLAGLTLVRISRRTQEIATRLALGATRGDILRQVWIENLVLAVIGSLAGLGLAELILAGLPDFLPKGMIPAQGLALDYRVLGFTLALSVGTSLLFGALPALVTRRVDLRTSLATSSRSIAGGSNRVRKTLIGAEIAITLVLIAGSGLLVRTLTHLETLPPGFDSHNVLTAKASLDDARYRDGAAFQTLLRNSVAAMKRIPGVEDAAAGLSLPYERGLNLPILILDGKQAGNGTASSMTYVTPEYFSTLRVPLLTGRGFTDSDTATSEPVVVVNAGFAKEFFGTTAVVGRHIANSFGASHSTPMEIIGVVSDVTKEQGIRSSAPLGTEPVYYMPATQFPVSGLATVHTWFQPSWIVRADAITPQLPIAMREAMAKVDPRLPFSGFYSMDQIMRHELETQRIEVLLLTVLAGLALLLSAVGVYALVSSLVVQQMREIGIRIALGASTGRVMREMLASGVVAAGFGIAAGLGISLLVLRVLKSELYGVGVYDPVTLIGAPLLLALIVLAASVPPALRAGRVDPASTLRSE